MPRTGSALQRPPSPGGERGWEKPPWYTRRRTPSGVFVVLDRGAESVTTRTGPTSSREVRQAFFDFFASKDHDAVPSSSLVPRDDATVLLTTAGMQQMVPYMLGRAKPPHPRLVSLQKCFRTTDIDKVGNARNLTFFEMLGNFSIGDYFKSGAIAYAWELVTQWLGLDVERLWVTVHPTDEEAVELWLAQGVRRERIVALEDNWWGPPGAEGPCGPDSELYYDRGEAMGGGEPDCAPGCDCDRYLEFWNLVFMQYFQDKSGKRTPLERPNIDTGMGLERVTALVQDVRNVYETDLFRPIIDGVAELAGTTFGKREQTDFALRVIADHARGMTFLADDGVVAGPDGREYIMRRIIRRAARYGRVLGIDRPFLGEVVRSVIDRMHDRYPSLLAQRDTIVEIVESEERRFHATLAAGLGRLQALMDEARESGARTIAGERLFQLHDTFGLPYELSEEILLESGLAADRAGFDRAMARQQVQSREGREESISRAAPIDGSLPATVFRGYETLETGSGILAVQLAGQSSVELDERQEGVLVLDATTFYAEGGGQVGDQGVVRTPGGLFVVRDAQVDVHGHVLHRGYVAEGLVRVGDAAVAVVDRGRREETTRHHTLTHLLHQSLRDVLGERTHQRGSLVAPRIARFDFNYEQPLSGDQRREVQQRINDHVLADLQVEWQVMSIEEARETGALMIFGEKYGDRVRVVRIGDFSKELCGGTHVGHSAEVGMAVILRETGVGSGLRRVEVVAGQAGLEQVQRRLDDYQEIARLLGVPVDDARRKVDELLGQLDEARREMQRLNGQLASRQASELTSGVRDVAGVKVLAARIEVSGRDGLTEQWDAIKAQQLSCVAFLGALVDGATSLLVGVTNDLVGRGLRADGLMRQFAAAAGGKGGGRETLARGSGSGEEQLAAALAAAPELVRQALGMST
ncbi:MAG: alanine--tRNA ligase [Chloroflexi bacterium]|nr:alanine--tRNA ligase [Chloroflexota bacterium]